VSAGIHLTEVTGPIDDAIEAFRQFAEANRFAPEDLIGRLISARSRAERAGIALHLAEKFVGLATTAPIDPGTTVVGRDLIEAIRRAKGMPCVLVHYQNLARDTAVTHYQGMARDALAQGGVA
jgi:hypothetical protein